MNNLFAQILGFVAIGISLAIFQINKRRVMLAVQIASSLLFGIHLLLLGAVTGALMSFLGAIRGCVFVNNEKKWAKSKYWLYLFLIIFWIVGILSWQNIYSLLPILGMTLGTIGYWIKNTSKMRLFSFTASSSWLIYAIVVKSYAGILGEILSFISIIIGIIRFDKKKLKKT
jgi:hypothetical protein